MGREVLEVKIKKLDSNAVIPSYFLPGDAGMDITAISRKEVGNFLEYGTGLAFELPSDYAMLIFPRSSLSNKDLILANHVGVLDSRYRGELKIRFRQIGDNIYEIGDRVAQLIVLPRPYIVFKETDELSVTERGDGGFGHTGK